MDVVAFNLPHLLFKDYRNTQQPVISKFCNLCCKRQAVGSDPTLQ